MPSDKRKAAIEAMAEALYRDSAKEQSDARTWAEMKAEHPADYEGVTRFYSRATAALDALLAVCPALGLRVVPVEMTREMAWELDMTETDVGTVDEPSPLFGWNAPWRAAIAAAPNVLGGSDGE